METLPAPVRSMDRSPHSVNTASETMIGDQTQFAIPADLFASFGGKSGTNTLSASGQHHDRTPVPCERSTQEAALCEAIEFAFQKSGYPLSHVRCRCEGATLNLHGKVSRFYHIQVTIEIAKRMIGERQIVHQIVVVPDPEITEFDDD